MTYASVIRGLPHKVTGGGGGGPLTVTYLARANSTSNGTNWSLTGVSFGTADADRHLVAVVGLRQNDGNQGVPSAVTIGGVSATMDAGTASVSGANGGSVSIWRAKVPTGTSGTVAVTAAATSLNVRVDLFSITGASTLTVTDSQTDTDTGQTDPLLATMSSVDGGALIACASEHVSGGDDRWSWSNATEHTDTGSDIGEQGNLSAASAEPSSASVALTATPTAGGNYKSAAAVTYEG